MGKKVKPLVIDLTPEQKRQFKAACAAEGLSMTEKIRDIIRRLLEKKT